MVNTGPKDKEVAISHNNSNVLIIDYHSRYQYRIHETLGFVDNKRL